MAGGRLLAALAALLWLASCGGNPPAPIEDHSRPGRSGAPPTYLVKRGDTLYSIAFRYGLDYRRLAAANSVAEPYTIYVGQKLLMAEREPPPRRAAATSPATAPKPSAQTGSGGRSSSAAVAGGSAAGTSAGQSSSAAGTRTSAAPRSSTASSTSPPVNHSVSSWRWPSGGAVVRRFDGERHKGLDIAGERGDAINATAAGRVVYAGSGIVGYGLVLIVRHNDEYLSAYGHTDALLVEEGDDVSAGQQVARMGSSGTDTVKLHFELRRRGRPVDPLTLLPSR